MANEFPPSKETLAEWAMNGTCSCLPGHDASGLEAFLRDERLHAALAAWKEQQPTWTCPGCGAQLTGDPAQYEPCDPDSYLSALRSKLEEGKE